MKIAMKAYVFLSPQESGFCMEDHAAQKAHGGGRVVPAEPTQIHDCLAYAHCGSPSIVDLKSSVLCGEKDGSRLAQKASTILWGKSPEGFLTNSSSQIL